MDKSCFKVISGGQTGIDQIGLQCAKDNGISTGGHAPKHYKTENGNMPQLHDLYSLVESTDSDYSTRTKLNVRNSDATIIFGDVTSPGSKLTLKIIKEYNKKSLINPSSEMLLKFIIDNDILVLNIAGNRGSNISSYVRSNVIQTLNNVFSQL